MILLEAGDDPYSRARPRDWEVLLAKPDEQLRLRIGGHSGDILHTERESMGELARTLAASTGLFEAPRAIDAALEAVRSVAPDAKAIAVALTKRQKGLVYQIALTSSSGTRVVEVSAKGGALLSVETVEAPDPMRADPRSSPPH